MSLLIKNSVINRKVQDILIEGSKICRIGENLNPGNSQILDGDGTAASPSLINGHTHSPMSLMRGAGDDLPLSEWLNTRMWPLEKRYSDEDYYWGNLLSFMEMIRTGTGYFNEMYERPEIALKALEKVPLKGMIHYVILDQMSPEKGQEQCAACEMFFKEANPSERISLGVALHSCYTCSRESIEWVRDFTEEGKLKVHLHLAETAKEVADCKKAYGLSPVEYFDSLGVLSERVLAAHCVHLSDRDIEILAHKGVTVIHNPASNMKLSSGVFPYKRLKDRGVPILLGTDGSGSNNNLDMLEEMKLAALLQKVHSGDAALMTAEEAFHMATKAGAQCFNTGSGEIKVGAEADLMLVDIRAPGMIPVWDLTSTLVYSASGQHVVSLVSGGQVLMENRQIPFYEEVRQQAQLCFNRLYDAELQDRKS